MLIFNYPYTDLYSLNLDWIIKAIKEVQQVIGELGSVVNSVNGQSGDVVLTNEMLTSILGSVVNSVNGQAGAVVITKEMLTTILEGVVNSFNGRSGTVQLLPADVNATRIDITWTSDPGDTIGSLTQAEIDALYADGKRILIFVNNVGSPDQIYFLTIVGDTVTPQPYTPTAATSGVLSVNGQSGVVTLNADNLPVALGETDTIGDALDSKQAVLTFDSAPTANSANPVTSGGVYTADQSLGNAITTLAGTVNQHSDQIEELGNALAYVINGDTYSGSTIPDGSYVLWNGTLYTANGAIPAGSISASNFSSLPATGGLNAVKKTTATTLESGIKIVRSGNVVELSFNVSGSKGIAVTGGSYAYVDYIPANLRPKDGISVIGIASNEIGTVIGLVGIQSADGRVFIQSATTATFYRFTMNYLI